MNSFINKGFINKIKYRWRAAPTIIKVIDITCWCLLLLVVCVYCI